MFRQQWMECQHIKHLKITCMFLVISPLNNHYLLRILINPVFISAASWGSLFYTIWGQGRLRSACVFTQSDQNFGCLHEAFVYSRLFIEETLHAGQMPMKISFLLRNGIYWTIIIDSPNFLLSYKALWMMKFSNSNTLWTIGIFEKFFLLFFFQQENFCLLFCPLSPFLKGVW